MEKISTNENFIRLIEQYQNLVFSICLKMTGDYFTAQDLSQETFVAAYKHLDDFDGQSEKAWLCRIASNKCIDYLKEAKRREMPVISDEMDTEDMVDTKDPLTCILNQEIMEELKHCCEALSPPYREVAICHFVEGRSAGEIATLKKMNIHTVNTRLLRAKKMLKLSFRKEMLKE